MIRKRLILALIVQLFLVLLFSGFYLQYRLQNVLEKELGSKLQSLAGSVAAQLDASLLTLLAPGDETTRLYRGMRQRLTDIAQSAELGRIMVFSN
ncbi:hypothetical protein JXO59_11560, partial [candidate division KSB1 bacterium]|nr:hypothetical protein [candidate division KSB1 bacterium]